MKKIRLLLFASLLTILSACSDTTDDLSEAVSQKIEQEADKLIQTAKDEGKKKIDETLSVGNEKLDSILSDLTEMKQSNNSSSEPNAIKTGGTTERIPVEYRRTVDGDTILVGYNGKEVKLRYLLTDTPESVHPQMGKQPFGEEASLRNQELLESGEVTIEFDVGERIDKYGRLLAYVYVDDVSVQETLIREGLARVAYVYPPNTRHLDGLEKAQELAKQEGLGIWSVENYAPKGFNSLE